MKKQKFELNIESKLGNLTIISEFIEKTMRQLGIDNSRHIYAVQLSVDEACTNIIQHAYSKNEGPISIYCRLSSNRDKFIVQIMDWGQSFDPTTIPMPDTKAPLNQRKEGGLGLFFIKKFMDIVKYDFSNNMNKLTMIKHLKSVDTSNRKLKNGNQSI